MRVHSLQAVGRKAQLNFTLHIFHQERPISERKVVGIEETLFLWHLALRDKRKKEVLRRNESTLQLELHVCV